MQSGSDLEVVVERQPLIETNSNDAPSNNQSANQSDNQSRWTSFMAQCQLMGVQCWSCFKNCCGTIVEGVKGCCACCGNCIWTLIGCCGGCSSLKGRCEPCCPLSKRWGLSKKGLADLLDVAATICVMGIVTLNIFCATYFVAWAPDTVDCLPQLTKDHPDISESIKKWMKVVVIGLPYTLFLPTLYIAGQAKAAQTDYRGLGLVAGGVIAEIVYMLCLGAVMMICASGITWWYVAIATGCLSSILVLTWGCCCHSPKCLRTCLHNSCCWDGTCQQVDIEAPAPAADQAAAAADHLVAPQHVIAQR